MYTIISVTWPNPKPQQILPNKSSPPPLPQKSFFPGGNTVGSAAAGDFTLVLEKLEGACLRCRVPPTSAEVVSFRLAGALASTTALHMWLTNGTVSFAQMADVAVSGGSFSVALPRDTMITLSTTVGQHKGQAATCTGAATCSGVYKPFPFPFNTTYEDGEVGRMAKFHADNGGAFEVRADAGGSGSGRHLFQASPRYPAGTQWAGNFDPITSLGATDWVNYEVTAEVMLMPAAPPYAVGDDLVPFPSQQGLLTDWTPDPISAGVYGGVCVRQIDQYSSGFCLLVGVGLAAPPPDDAEAETLYAGGSRNPASVGWVLQAGAMGMARSPGTILAHGPLDAASFDLKAYHRLSLRVQGQKLVGDINGKQVASVTNTVATIPPAGQAALRSSFSYTQFDNLSINGLDSGAYPDSLFAKHLLYPPKAPPGGPQDPALPLTAQGSGSLYGCSFTVGASPLTVTALARFGAGFVAAQSHTVSILDAESKKSLASASVAVGGEGAGGDLNGYVWATLDSVVTLAAGKTYLLVSSEGSDTFFSNKVWMQAQPGLLAGLVQPASKVGGAWHLGPASTPPPVPPADLHYIVSKSTQECWDTRGAETLDLWACVQDGHNELFNYSAATGLITTGPRDAVSGHCVVGAAPSDAQLPPTSAIAACDAHNPHQVFDHTADGQLTLRSDKSMCLTAGPKANNAGVRGLPTLRVVSELSVRCSRR